MAKDQATATKVESPPGPALAATLGLIVMFFLPLLDGGYSGSGFQVGFVILPLAAAIGWGVCRERPALAIVALLAFLLSGLMMLGWISPGRTLWFYIMAIPTAWVISWVLLRQVPERKDLFFPVITVSAVCTAIYGWFLWYGAGTIHYQLSSTFGLHNAYAGYLLLAWPAAAAAAFLAQKPLHRWFYVAATVVLALTLVLTYSRASWVMFALQLSFLAVIALIKLRKGAIQPQGLIWSGAGLVVAVGTLMTLEPVRNALASITNFSGYSMQGRLRYWSAALEIFGDYPVFGVGLGNFAYVYPQYQQDFVYYSVDPHSWPLQLLCELGLIGLIAILLVITGFVIWAKKLWQATDGSLTAGLLIAALGGSMLHAAMDFDYTFSATTALIGALLAYGAHLSTPAGESRVINASWGKALVVLSVVLLLGVAMLGEAFTTERYNLDRLRYLSGIKSPTAQQIALKANLLRQCIRFNRWNAATHYQLATLLVMPGQGTEAKREGNEHLARSLELNNRYPRAWALTALIGRSSEQSEKDMAKALSLDPYNYPEHYWHYASMAEDDRTRKERLLDGMEHIQANEPITPLHVRPTWYELNPLFAEWWYELARLEDNEVLSSDYRKRAARFEVYWQGQMEQVAVEGDSS